MLTLDGKKMPSFMKVNNIEFSLLPPIKNNLLQVRGKDGAYLFSQDSETRTFTVNYTITAERINGVMSIARELAEWLHHKEPVKFIIDDEPDKYYLVVPDGETNVTEIVNIGQGSIQFLCIENYAFGDEKVHTFSMVDAESVAEFEVGGTTETHPQIEVTLQEDITSLTIESDEHSIIIGEPAQVTEAPANPSPLVLTDRMLSMDGWLNNSADKVDGGVPLGSFTQSGQSLRVLNGDFGTSDKWHGPSAVKTLDRPIHDFDINFRLGLSSDSKKEVGRVELYLLDKNDVQFGKISLHDSFTTTSKKRFEARAGNWGTNDDYFMREYPTDWDSFYGRIFLTREGRKWTASVAQLVGGKAVEIYESSWFDSSNKWEQFDLAKIQIHIGTYGNYTPSKDMYISHIVVKERLTLADSEAPIIAIKNDVITVDNSKMLVYLNGEPRFDLINPASNFIKLQKGQNTLSVSPAKADLKITYPERWL